MVCVRVIWGKIFTLSLWYIHKSVHWSTRVIKSTNETKNRITAIRKKRWGIGKTPYILEASSWPLLDHMWIRVHVTYLIITSRKCDAWNWSDDGPMSKISEVNPSQGERTEGLQQIHVCACVCVFMCVCVWLDCLELSMRLNISLHFLIDWEDSIG